MADVRGVAERLLEDIDNGLVEHIVICCIAPMNEDEINVSGEADDGLSTIETLGALELVKHLLCQTGQMS